MITQSVTSPGILTCRCRPHVEDRRLALPRIADERGSVETAIAYLLGIAAVLGIVELAMMCYTFGVVSEAARAGVRYASIHGADSSNCSGPTHGCGDPGAAMSPLRSPPSPRPSPTAPPR